MKGNTVSISGNLTRDAETREFANGNMLVSFSICWNARKKEGESWVNVPNFFDCKIFCSGKQFSTFLEGLHK